MNPAPTLEIRYPVVARVSTKPTAPTGTPKSARIDGQATPSRPSGSPRLAKPR